MIAVTVNNISKDYTLYPSPKYLFREIFPFQANNNFKKVFPIKEVNFQISKGEVCAFIGKNGSGKSTLLALIAGIISPTNGTVETNGKVSTILELGAGFREELTGRQNIYLSASILGISKKEINAKLNEIIEFSGLESSIDDPLNTYSTGMIMRLGFSISIHVDFDILLVDEVLSVGDLLFRRKCLAKLRQLKKERKTILIASHSLADVAGICNRVMLINNGSIVMDGHVEDVIRRYMEDCEKEEKYIGEGYNPVKTEKLYGNALGEMKITYVHFFDENNNQTDTFETGKKMTIKIGYNAIKKVVNPLFRVQFFRNDGLWVHGTNTYRQNLNLGCLEGEGAIELRYEQNNLLDADYFVSVGIWPDEYKSLSMNLPYDYHELSYIIRVKSKRMNGAGIVFNPFQWSLIKN